MKVGLFMRKAIVLSGKGIKTQNSYYLPDMSYGQFLIYDQQLRPVYYIDFFDSLYKEMDEYIVSNKINAGTLLTRLLDVNKVKNLSVDERCWWMYRYGKEDSVLYELEPFPISYWANKLTL